MVPPPHQSALGYAHKGLPFQGRWLGAAETERSQQICDNLSVTFGDSIPTPFVPSGHFPLIGGIGPWEGSLWYVQNNKIQCKKVQSDKSRLHLLLTANIQRQLLTNSIPPYQAARSKTPVQ